jgi:hypothetical protein
MNSLHRFVPSTSSRSSRDKPRIDNTSPSNGQTLRCMLIRLSPYTAACNSSRRGGSEEKTSKREFSGLLRVSFTACAKKVETDRQLDPKPRGNGSVHYVRLNNPIKAPAPFTRRGAGELPSLIQLTTGICFNERRSSQRSRQETRNPCQSS